MSLVFIPRIPANVVRGKKKTVTVAGSVANMDDVQRIIHKSPSRIAGVLQMSMVIEVRQRS